jgi:hypothetical protein
MQQIVLALSTLLLWSCYWFLSTVSHIKPFKFAGLSEIVILGSEDSSIAKQSRLYLLEVVQHWSKLFQVDPRLFYPTVKWTVIFKDDLTSIHSLHSFKAHSDTHSLIRNNEWTRVAARFFFKAVLMVHYPILCRVEQQ